MGRSLNGNLIGRAAQEELADLRQALMEDEERRADELFYTFVCVRDELKVLDPTGWEAYYDEQVPDWKGWINCQPAIDAIQARVDILSVAQTEAISN